MNRNGPAPRLLAAAVALMTLAGATGCTATASPTTAPTAPAATVRPLDTAEAERLALTRFLNFDAGVREITLTVTDGGRDYTLSGWVDFPAGIGYATVSSGGERQLLAWSAGAVSTSDGAIADGPPPVPPPGLDDGAAGWRTSELLPERSRLHAALAVILATGSDRPDNPLLLRQTDARWLRADEVDGVAVDVFAGPTADEIDDPGTGTDGAEDAVLRYWIDESGLLHRLEARLGGAGDWEGIEFGEAVDVAFASAFEDAR